ncbi:hypothetical protein Tco_1263173 [Tanacetum coccineum]
MKGLPHPLDDNTYYEHSKETLNQDVLQPMRFDNFPYSRISSMSSLILDPNLWKSPFFETCKECLHLYLQMLTPRLGLIQCTAVTQLFHARSGEGASNTSVDCIVSSTGADWLADCLMSHRTCVVHSAAWCLFSGHLHVGDESQMMITKTLLLTIEEIPDLGSRECLQFPGLLEPGALQHLPLHHLSLQDWHWHLCPPHCLGP